MLGDDKKPVDLSPEQALAQGMTLRQYADLEHGREHNRRIAGFRRVQAQLRAASIHNPDLPATRRDIALLIAVLYGHHSAYSHNIPDMKQAEAFAAALEAMGGRL